MDLLSQMEQYANAHYIPIVKKETLAYLEVLLKQHKPKRILEIGTAIGYSALWFDVFAEKQAVIDTIEIDADMVCQARANVKAFGAHERVHVVLGDALDVLGCFAAAKKQYDFIFMDAAKGQYGAFFPHCLEMLAPGGVLISDNVLYREMIREHLEHVPRKVITLVRNLREYIDMLTRHPLLETEIVEIGDGMAVSRRK